MKLQTDFKFRWRVVKTFLNAQFAKKITDNKGDQKLTSTEKERSIIVECSSWLNDKLLERIPENQHANIQYQVNTCCPGYARLQNRSEKRMKQRQLHSLVICRLSCFICNQMKSKGDTKRLMICEAKRASLFISAIKFNKDTICIRCALLEKPGGCICSRRDVS